MVKGPFAVVSFSLVLLAAAPVSGQQRARTDEEQRLLRNVIVMERALQEAVHFGAEDFVQRLSLITAAAQGALSGAPQVEGYLIPAHGPFFVVKVPRLNTAFTIVATYTQGERPQTASRPLRPGQVIPTNTGLTSVEAPPPAAPVTAMSDTELLNNLPGAYRATMLTSIKVAMLDNSDALNIAPADVLTVAVKRDVSSTLSTRADTAYLTVKGAILHSFRQKAIGREQAMSSIEVRED